MTKEWIQEWAQACQWRIEDDLGRLYLYAPDGQRRLIVDEYFVHVQTKYRPDQWVLDARMPLLDLRLDGKFLVYRILP